MGAIRLITDEVFSYTPNIDNTELERKQTYIITKPTGKALVCFFVSHLKTYSHIHPLVQPAIENDIGVVYVCDKIPDNPIIDPHVYYLECPDKWFIHTLFINPLNFIGTVGFNVSLRTAQAFSSFTGYNIPMLRSSRDFTKLSRNLDKTKNNTLVEIVGGVGDHLLSIPTIKTLAEKGKKVFVLCEEHRKPCFENLKYIQDFYTRRDQVDSSKFNKIYYLHFGQMLNDYRQDFNKQNRIYSVANLCSLSKEDLTIDKPEILLTEEEIKEAKTKWGVYSKKVFLGFDSARIDSKLPDSMAQEKIDMLKRQGCTVFVASNRNKQFKNCIDLNKKISLRQLFALIATVDCVLTVDTSFLHIAAAFNKKTFCLMNYFKPEWRTSTYSNCVAYEPQVSCYPCVSKQFVSSQEWQCHIKSCYEYHNWIEIFSDINTYFNNKKDFSTIQKAIKSEQVLPKSIDETKLPGRVISPTNTKEKKVAALWMGGMGDAVMLSYLCRAIARKHPEANIDAYVRDLNHTQIFVFDAPRIKAQYSKEGWHKTFSKIKNNYDVIYEFRPYPYVWNKDSSLDKPFNSELYYNWQKSTANILESSETQTFKYYADLVELDLSDSDMKMNLLCREHIAKNVINNYNIEKPYISISSGCDQNVGVMKLWEDSKLEDLVDKIKEKGFNVIQFGSDKDKAIKAAKKIQANNLIDLAYLLSESELHISNEGGLVHLAHSVGTKSLVLFGPTTPNLYGYPDNKNIYSEKCPSCWWTKQGWSQQCKRGFNKCINLESLTVSEVFNAFLDFHKEIT